ncbi:Precorrin-2 dehydrogenase [compost metagenome]
MTYYVPVMLNLFQRRCIIIGGGLVAERKVAPLLDAGADIVLISPTITATLQQVYEERRIEWVNRRYQSGDLEGAFLVFAATDHSETNQMIVEESNFLGIPVNHTGDGESGSFITPSVLRRQELVIAVSTSGAGPTASRNLCEDINKHYGDHYEEYIQFLSSVRSEVKRTVHHEGLRKKIFRSLADMEILSEIAKGNFRQWSQYEISQWIDSWIEGHREE